MKKRWVRAPISVSTQATQLLEFLVAKKIEPIAKVLEKVAFKFEQAFNCLSVSKSLLLLQLIQFVRKGVGFNIAIECQPSNFRY
ncbi:hypothetical protein MAA5396_02040 [Marinovum algicola]|uniref:Uncharacterized protein n=1 Tax=Marinovum algicola TaxID=42444 RepID=A0A975W9T8_9RHOB|nr:hypothetical protein SAMN04487940_105293 [Marinovum algicola]SLN41623.1 hypothetical protein MAA5396_02040 [Marinovum algicola]